MSDLTLQPIAKPFDLKFSPPGSKSLTNRALVIAALADGMTELGNVLFADDTMVMLESLGKLGFHLEILREETIRFLTALCALGESGTYTLDGIARMRQRPIRELVDLLRNLGARIEYAMGEGFPPVRVTAHGLPGGLLRYGAAQSSQYLSAVLMAAPYALRHEVRVDLEPNQTSWPYVAMTMQLMDHFGVTPELIRDPQTGDPRQVIVPQGKYKATPYAIEPDASNATYFMAAAAMNEGSKITIEGLGKRSLQGDVGFADVLHRMGADLVFGKDFITISGTDRLEGVDVDLSGMPDTAQTLAVVALFAEGQTVIRGLHTLRVKETDRLAALQNELTKFGAKVEIENGDTLVIEPPEHLAAATVDTYDDHRMAMSFALAGTKRAGVTIREVECTNKTYPGYFDDLRKLGVDAR
jgi:3-phosphoshikimate 1-carboxyvinyltransferase